MAQLWAAGVALTLVWAFPCQALFNARVLSTPNELRAEPAWCAGMSRSDLVFCWHVRRGPKRRMNGRWAAVEAIDPAGVEDPQHRLCAVGACLGMTLKRLRPTPCGHSAPVGFDGGSVTWTAPVTVS